MDRPRLALLLLALVPLVALRCPGGPGPLRFHEPGAARLVDDPLLAVRAEVADTIDPASLSVQVVGVDLVAALGLTPPFVDASGVVSLGGAAVVVSGFTFDPAPSGPSALDVDLAGLPLGAHELRLVGMRSGGQEASATRQVTRVAPFAEALRGATPAAAVGTGSSSDGLLLYGRIGEPAAAAPVSNATGALRAGFVHAAESRIAGAPVTP